MKIIVLFSAFITLQTFADKDVSENIETRTVATIHSIINESGCWVKLYDEPLYRGHQLIVYDGMELPTLKISEDSDWTGQIRSLEVGPRAKVTLYRDENYVNEELSVEPGNSLAGPWLRTSSVKLDCVSALK
jgi:hypothetical protein